MKRQRKYRLPAGHELLIELERNKRAKPVIEGRPLHNLENEHLFLNIGHRKSRKPVTLAKKA
jgi:hypothetical protein